jgi:hypothetical protein
MIDAVIILSDGCCQIQNFPCIRSGIVLSWELCCIIIMQNRYQNGILEMNMYKDIAIGNHDMLLMKAPMNVSKRVGIIITRLCNFLWTFDTISYSVIRLFNTTYFFQIKKVFITSFWIMWLNVLDLSTVLLHSVYLNMYSNMYANTCGNIKIFIKILCKVSNFKKVWLASPLWI